MEELHEIIIVALEVCVEAERWADTTVFDIFVFWELERIDAAEKMRSNVSITNAKESAFYFTC